MKTYTVTYWNFIEPAGHVIVKANNKYDAWQKVKEKFGLSDNKLEQLLEVTDNVNSDTDSDNLKIFTLTYDENSSLSAHVLINAKNEVEAFDKLREKNKYKNRFPEQIMEVTDQIV